ncbi:uncharacterized protein LOC131250160 [Magnolia sinica]|uniref:uncharacterized protein LOC131250160 n=1 Tax=Magnolia sinica TaxID=86752 RepID=UPI002659D336|nr:uncharacterized protein LOC131250160 [Magnolia sinica]
MGQETSTGMGKVRKSQATVGPTYEDFEPLIDWVQEEEHDTIFLNMPGFKKEQLKIEVNELHKMKISGERPIQGNNWTRFCHEFTVPDYCHLSKILCIDFTNGILSVSLPKMTTQMSGQDQPMLKDEIPVDRQDQPMPFKESYMYGKESCECSKGSSLIGLNRPRELNVNVVVATMVGLALGIGVTYCAKRH